jgi:hypothetical protein
MILIMKTVPEPVAAPRQRAAVFVPFACAPAPALSATFGSHLVPLADGRPGLRRGLHVDILEPEAAPAPGEAVRSESEPAASRPAERPPILDFIASDETLDRYDEILVADGWRLDNYRRNPVFQNAHQYGDIIFTLGRALLTEVRHGKLYQRVEFATGVNPMARIAFGLYQHRFLNAVSVGFIPIRWQEGAPHSRAFPRSASAASGRGEDAPFRRKYLEQELLEVSAVGIPANPNALALGLKAGVVQKADLQDLLDLLRGLCDFPAPPGILPAALPTAPASPPAITPPLGDGCPPDFRSLPAAPRSSACASGSRRNEAHWLQLARDLRRLLREA